MLFYNTVFAKIKRKDRPRPSSLKEGFSLVELIVSLTIFGLITTVILVRNAQFNNSILLTNLAYDVALSVRQSQIYGLSVKEASVGSSNFDIGYGVHFSNASMTSYSLFIDNDKDEHYDGGAELLETYTVRQGNIIKDFCVIESGGNRCLSTNDITALNIVFIRPDPDAIITADSVTKYRTAKIYLESPAGTQKIVVVESTGQISIQSL